jgi:hypothetical protein
MKTSPAIFSAFCRTMGLPAPIAEHRFHPVRKWRYDYAWPEHLIALEVEGGVWLSQHGKKSRHFTGAGAVGDMEKYNAAAVLGWRVLKCQPRELMTTKTAQLLAEVLKPKP